MSFINREYLQKQAKKLSVKRSDSRGVRSALKTLSSNKVNK